MNLSQQIELPLPGSAQMEPVGPARAPALMSFEAFRALLAEQPDLEELQLQGAGEPLAHPRFFDMVAYAGARGVRVSTTTNFLSISDARIEECVASGLSRLDVAPGAAHPLDCDYLRTGSKLRRALRNVRRLSHKKKSIPEIRVVLILLRSNLQHLSELIRLSREHGADVIAFQHLWHDVCPARRFVEAESLLKEKVDFKEAQAAAGELGVALELPLLRRCDRPWRAIHVGASGEALPCPAARTAQRLNLGNLRRDGIVRVWNNDAYREFRERFESDNPPDLCRRCSVYEGTA
ncbi:MAG TPA: radical SAM protein [Burkholderiales bacterium]|nr:radical SAM protein [Burkholderiales bacterium]